MFKVRRCEEGKLYLKIAGSQTEAGRRKQLLAPQLPAWQVGDGRSCQMERDQSSPEAHQ